MKEFNLEKAVPLKLVLLNGEGGKIEFKNYQVTFTMSSVMSSTDNVYDVQLDQNISFAKVLFFLTEILNESVLLEKDHSSHVIRYLAEYENNLVILPDLSEATIITALHRKLNSISQDCTRVEKVSLRDVDDGLNYNYTCTAEHYNEDNGLPCIEEWMGECSFYSEPWWDRPDQLTWDHKIDSAEELEAARQIMNESGVSNTEAFDDIECEVRSVFNVALKEAGIIDEKEGELIEVDFVKKQPVIEKWTPKIL